MDDRLTIVPGASIRSQVLEFYREAIRSGRLSEGAVLPPAQKLAAEVGTAEANVHYAIAQLAREGLIVRRPKVGSIVIGRTRMHRVAFFLPELYTRRGERVTRPLAELLERELAAQGIPECQVIYDTASGEGWKLLSRLAASRRIQGVVVRSMTGGELDRFARLPVPFTAITALGIPGGVSFFTERLADAMVEGVKRQGCRTAGIIHPGGGESYLAPFYRRLRTAAEASGIEIRPGWIFGRDDYGADILDIDHFGYVGIGRTLSSPQRPEAVMLFSDDLVAGVTMGLYARGLRVPGDLKLVVHRTVENPVIFPFDCMLVEQSIAELVRLLVGKLIDGFEGRAPRQGELSIRISRNDGAPEA